MKRFKVQYLKIQSVASLKQSPTMIAEQDYLSDSEKIDIAIPSGYALLAVTQYLPVIDQTEEGKKLSEKQKTQN